MSNETVFGYGLIPLTPEREAELEALGEEYHRKRKAMRTATVAVLPTKVDLSPQFPPIRHQGQYGTCVAFASAAVLDYWDGKLSGRGAGTIVRSPLHLFYPHDVEIGMRVDDAMRNAAQRGACAEAERPYATDSEAYKFNEPITTKQQVSGSFWTNAAPYPLVKLYNANSSTQTKIQGIKEHLASGIPVLMSLTVYDFFNQPAAGGIITPKSPAEKRGDHLIVIVGYDDSTGMFKLRNSWGTSWGSGGHGYILYNDIFSLTSHEFFANDYYNFTYYADGQTLMNPYMTQGENDVITITNFRRGSYRFVRFVPTRTGSHVFAMNNNDFKLTVYTEDYNTVVASESVKTITANLVSNRVYIIQVYCDATLSNVDSATLTMGTGSGGGSTPGESSANAITVSGTSASGTLKDTKDLFFKYTAPRSGSYTFTISSGFDSFMQLLNSSGTMLSEDDDSNGGGQPKIVYTLTGGFEYFLKVYGYGHGAGKYGAVTLNVVEPSTGSAPGACSLSVASPTTSSLTLNYSATGATSYDIYRGNTKIQTGITTTSYTDSGLSANTSYTYYVIARNAYGSSQSSNVTEKTSAGPIPGTCTLTVGSPTANSLTLTYSATGATTYDIYRDGVLITAGRTLTTFTDTGLQSNKMYSYYVIARNVNGSSTSATKSGTTLQQSGPTPVIISEGFEGSKYAFTFTGDWADSKTEASTGTWSRKSKAITHKETSTMQFTENIPSNYAQTPTLKFDYFVSSEANYDYLEVLVNGVSKLKASGETGWVKDYSVTLGTGNQTVTFNYVKDASTSKGQDCAYVDNIRVSY
ncbi:C1 family peptidase [Brevibacillus reuszeri]|uniref:C1 family peptidase n=1 Tax=Brevibacillus reuszeri TaxID=54915 RepID=UPI0028A19222|nr:C1 family peptidase [Brevibacillus reuszeri]